MDGITQWVHRLRLESTIVVRISEGLAIFDLSSGCSSPMIHVLDNSLASVGCPTSSKLWRIWISWRPYPMAWPFWKVASFRPCRHHPNQWEHSVCLSEPGLGHCPESHCVLAWGLSEKLNGFDSGLEFQQEHAWINIRGVINWWCSNMYVFQVAF